ncbi:hypothetical protein [Psychromonas sp. KJ10-2]|uniref:hypothetical protein n=1 Tax=Psychromonas sp. KJ10-2 TaxID=3391822 RepID=UPI0039B47F56
MADNDDKLFGKARVMGVFSIVVLLISFCFSDVMLDVADKEIAMMSDVYGEKVFSNY